MKNIFVCYLRWIRNVVLLFAHLKPGRMLHSSKVAGLKGEAPVTGVTKNLKMTRYANLGFKRNYVQAGFDETKDQNAEKDEVSKTVGGDPGPSKDEPSKKKRKRAKPIVSKVEDKGEGTSIVSKDASKEEEGSQEPKLSNRKLYKLRRQKGKRKVGYTLSH
jgi:hypothetical protein